MPGSRPLYQSRTVSEAIGVTRETSSPRAALGEKLKITQYTGYRPMETKEIMTSNPADLYEECRRSGIVGYSGHVHGARSSYGLTYKDTVARSLEGSDVERHRTSSFNNTNGDGFDTFLSAPSTPGSSRPTSQQGGAAAASSAPISDNGVPHSFRSFGSQMDRVERYDEAIAQLERMGHSQDMLLKMVQAKIQERVSSAAEQVIKVRKMFEAFDIDGSGDMDEIEFRLCLERLNVQLTDVQALALFALFDEKCEGALQWEEFARRAMVANPRGGTAVLPKCITATVKDY